MYVKKCPRGVITQKPMFSDPRLYARGVTVSGLAACDLAVVQGGLTTAMELTANRRPFLYFPLSHHFEQNYHVRHRLDHYRAGRCLDYHATGPDDIATEIGREVDYRPVATDGAARAAAMLASLL